MCNIREMEVGELKDLRDRISARLKQLRPVRLKIKHKRCGKENCFCGQGPPDNEWGNLHGPYIFASYTDRETGKTRVQSLGLWYSRDQLEYELSDLKVVVTDYFTITPAAYQKVPSNERHLYWHYKLTEREFERKYHISVAEDKMGRYRDFYGTKANFEAYEAVKRDGDLREEALTSQMAIVYGIGSVKGQKILEAILARDYYIADELTSG